MDGFADEPRQPIVTGTSVLGVKYQDGVMLAADNLGKSTSLLLLQDLYFAS